MWHQETPQPAAHSFSRHLLGGCRWEAEITQQGPCLSEPSGPKSGLGKRQTSPTTGSSVEIPWSVPTLPHRVLIEGSGRQRAIHMDCAVRVWLSWTLDSNYLRGLGAGRLPGSLFASQPPTQQPPLVLGCGKRAGQGSPWWPESLYASYLCLFKLGRGRGKESPVPPVLSAHLHPELGMGHCSLCIFPLPRLQVWTLPTWEAE